MHLPILTARWLDSSISIRIEFRKETSAIFPSRQSGWSRRWRKLRVCGRTLPVQDAENPATSHRIHFVPQLRSNNSLERQVPRERCGYAIVASKPQTKSRALFVVDKYYKQCNISVCEIIFMFFMCSVGNPPDEFCQTYG